MTKIHLCLMFFLTYFFLNCLGAIQIIRETLLLGEGPGAGGYKSISPNNTRVKDKVGVTYYLNGPLQTICFSWKGKVVRFLLVPRVRLSLLWMDYSNIFQESGCLFFGWTTATFQGPWRPRTARTGTRIRSRTKSDVNLINFYNGKVKRFEIKEITR